ncbi:prepilin-type N-terminal cleavage/methylation domain-containing protein [Gilvimarinus agarilyticus]|uniref:prepilin-type N-terminal cleavage/methylation domain-containing protein n=1 Tax=Gilvimarinus agarilyticus TaxID=679259 RepID=UPI000696C3E4|nr:prepilin-type N-terminal cleavage/methylation domain-containing protein [Gilvimarinus agarilyticus]
MKRSRSKGFTLVEVVVAITVLSLIVLATVTAMQTLGVSRHRVQAHAQGVAEMRAVTRFIRRTLEQAKPVYVYESGRSFGQYFYGSNSQLLLAAPLPIPGHSGGITSLRLYVDDNSQLVVQLNDQPITSLQSIGDGRAYVLASDITGFSVSYRENRAAPWVEFWGLGGDTHAPPDHVRIKIRQGERFWPTIIVAVAKL